VGKKADWPSHAFAVDGVSVEFVRGLCDVGKCGERDNQAKKGDDAVKAPAGPIGKEMPCAIDQDCRQGEDQHL